ncbi:MAG: FKBP-type peptidyl-prolyl cis-trans isomerase [Lachnospiraceae bacterium]|nr:FKBP-type peptidyl-prolyl cis-trans isomerase [Lachnospiraceae bacterium]
MKRILAILLALCLMLSLTACSSETKPEETDTSSAPQSEAVTDSSAEASSEEIRETISAAVPYAEGDAYYTFDCSKDLNENGYFSIINAADHVKLPEDLTISIPYDVHTPSAEDVQEAVDSILGSYASDEQITNRAVADGDTINIDYTGTLNGVAFDGGSTGGAGTTVIVGVTNYVDDFLQKLIGHMPGETFDIDINFPADYGNASLAGQATVFNVTINYIVGEKITPELTDDFVATNLSASYGWTTAEEMKKEISDGLSNQTVQDYIYDYLVSNSVISEIPQELKDYMTNYLIYYHSYYAAGSGVTLPVLLSNMGFESMSALLDHYAEELDGACKEELVMQAAAKELGIEVSTEDLETYFQEEIGRTDYSLYEEYFGLPYVKKMVIPWKLVKVLKEKAVMLPQ